MRSTFLPAAPIPHVLAWLFGRRELEYGARIALVLPFVTSGFIKLYDFQGALAEVTALGLEPAAFFAAAIILTQLGGSALFMTRRFCWLGAAMLSGFTVIATVLAHSFWLVPAAERAHEIATFFEHIAIVGGFVAAAILAHQRTTFTSATQMPFDL